MLRKGELGFLLMLSFSSDGNFLVVILFIIEEGVEIGKTVITLSKTGSFGKLLESFKLINLI